MSEKYPLPAGQEKCFYLTSPFIEPATSGIWTELYAMGGKKMGAEAPIFVPCFVRLLERDRAS